MVAYSTKPSSLYAAKLFLPFWVLNVSICSLSYLTFPLTFCFYSFICRKSLASSNLRMKSRMASLTLNGLSGSRNCVVPAALAVTVWSWTRVIFQRQGRAWWIRNWSSTLFPEPRYKYTHRLWPQKSVTVVTRWGHWKFLAFDHQKQLAGYAVVIFCSMNHYEKYPLIKNFINSVPHIIWIGAYYENCM